MSIQRAWESGAWQNFALRLIRQRHGGQNVQVVPDTVQGDAGLECFTTDGCLYQCYAPEQVSDVKKAASAMKAKGRRDLSKLNGNKQKVESLLNGLKAKRWILVCPFLDDKEVVASIRDKGSEIRSLGLSFLDGDFEALVQSQMDFDAEIEQLRLESLGPSLAIVSPTDEEVRLRSETEVSRRIGEKLLRAFPRRSAEILESQYQGYVKAHLRRENALDSLKRNQPILWEKSVKCLDAEEDRLVALGASGGIASEQLRESVSRLEAALKSDLPNLESSVITTIALGTVSEWLMRCPLDFPADS